MRKLRAGLEVITWPGNVVSQWKTCNENPCLTPIPYSPCCKMSGILLQLLNVPNVSGHLSIRCPDNHPQLQMRESIPWLTDFTMKSHAQISLLNLRNTFYNCNMKPHAWLFQLEDNTVTLIFLDSLYSSSTNLLSYM